ncbi:MAG: hypothetical protein HPY60_06075 [Candidatus Methanofastidiosum sp.]|nr:hypothetical protein [Methanofastidiosum sp.]NYT13483.1 hypothetical protein [Candidatus Methanofastidiosa archaeon]
MKKEIKSFDIGSVAKMFFFIGLIIGLIAGIIFAIAFVIAGALGPQYYPEIYGSIPPNAGALVALGGIVGFPIAYAVSGTILGIIFAGFYNIIARAVGGIKADFIE